MGEFTKDTIISEVLEKAPGAAPVFFSIGMPVSYTHLDVYKRQVILKLQLSVDM